MNLTKSQYKSFVELPTILLDELYRMYENAKKEKAIYDRKTRDEMYEDLDLYYAIQDNYEFFISLEMEIVRKEANMSALKSKELEEIIQKGEKRVDELLSLTQKTPESQAELSSYRLLVSTAVFELQRREWGFAREPA